MSSNSYKRPIAPINQAAKKSRLAKSPINDLQNRSVSSSRKLPIPQQNINYSRKSQTADKGGRKLKFDSQMDLMQKQLTNNKNKLCSCMQIFTMLQNSSQIQRCLQHNNTLSLYCLNQRRILCVNCLYGMHRHRSHKVIPLKDCMDQVQQDNRKLKIIIQEQIKKLDFSAKIAQQNIITIQSQMRKVLADLQLEYNVKIDQIKAKHQKSKNLIKQIFIPVIDTCKGVKNAILNFRFNVWKAFTMYGDQKPTEDNQIMKQLLFVTIVELCQFRNRTITKTQLDSMSRRIRQHL